MQDEDGNDIRLIDLWPKDEEIDAIVESSVKPEQFNAIYTPLFDLKQSKKAESLLYDWQEMSTYIRRPP